MVDLKCEKCGRNFFFSDFDEKNFEYDSDDLKKNVSVKKIKLSMKNMLRFFAEMPFSANLFPLDLESSIQKQAESSGAAPMGRAGGQTPPIEKN